MRRVTFLAAALCVLWSFSAMAYVMPIEGLWKLDEKASKNVPDSMKMVDLKIEMKGRQLSTQRLFDGAPIGEPLVLTPDGVPVAREIAKGQTGNISLEWKAGGRLLEQIVKMKAQNLIDVIQTTHTTVTDDGDVMTRLQTTRQGGEITERVLIYRRKK